MGAESGSVDWRDWHLPLSREDVTLGEALADLKRVGAAPEEIPLVVRLVENPSYEMPVVDLFHGRVDLHAHDCIHILLGRGLLSKDEAFVIGYTMGSTRRMGCAEESLFTLIARKLYPGIYRFTADDVTVFRDALRLAFICDGSRLDQVNYPAHFEQPLAEVRRRLGIDAGLLAAYYSLEKRRYPDCPESRRLLD